MTPLETLKAARQLITDPAKWTQGVAARNRLGSSIDPLAENAFCFCSLGAIRNVVASDDHAFERASDALRSHSPTGVAAAFNDTHTHAEVLALFDKAIAELEAVQ
jgi:hypothetical protein